MTLFSKQKRGYTLIETLVTMGIFVILMAGMMGLFKSIYSDSIQRQVTLGTIDQARAVIYTFANEIRNARPGIDGSYPVNSAGDSEIIFFTNYNPPTATINRIRYYQLGSSLYKGVIVPSGSPLRYSTTTEVSSVVFTGIIATSSPLFNYYDGNFAGTTTPLVQPVNVNFVKYVAMNLTALTNDVGSTTRTFSVTSGATIRNLKTNLGN